LDLQLAQSKENWVVLGKEESFMLKKKHNKPMEVLHVLEDEQH
jgi:hypothetical protein